MPKKPLNLLKTILGDKGYDVEVEYNNSNAKFILPETLIICRLIDADAGPVYLSLNGGVIAGWSFVIPKMRIGGKYRAYIPWELAYGEQGGKESLCFFIELKGKGPEGSLAKKPPGM